MPKYTFSAQVSVFLHTEVEASSEEEAFEIAEQRNLARLPTARDLGWNAKTQWLIDEENGKPSDICLESVD